MTVATKTKDEKLLCDYEEASEIMDCTSRHVRNLASRGLMPRPIKIGGNVRFRRQEILDWIAAGCPAVSRSSEAATAD